VARGLVGLGKRDYQDSVRIRTPDSGGPSGTLVVPRYVAAEELKQQHLVSNDSLVLKRRVHGQWWDAGWLARVLNIHV
jgi:hypothetical protein